jgi:Fic family protein
VGTVEQSSLIGDHRTTNYINVVTHYVCMYVERRILGKSVKHYIVYSYREKGRVRKVRRYLGANLSKDALAEAKGKALKNIKSELDSLRTEVFAFSLTKDQLDRLNRQAEVKVDHLQGFDWRVFTERFTYNTNAIEGSSVRLDEVPRILQKARTKDPEELETKGVAEAVEYIRTTKEDLSLSLILKLHRLCFQGAKGFAGSLRDVEVVIRDSMGTIVHAGVPVARLKPALDDLIVWHKKNRQIFKPLVLATIVHNQFEHIHPFQDGNGRVGRLLLNYILLRNKHPPINITLEDRAEYYQTLQAYSKDGDIRPTVRFLIKQYKKTLKQVTTRTKKS